MNVLHLKKQLTTYFEEDLGFGDATGEALLQNEKGRGEIKAKQAGIFFGEEIIQEGFKLLDAGLKVDIFKRNGEPMSKNEIIAAVTGSSKTILTGERVILNLLQRLAGIASLTHQACREIEGTGVHITDTRKTTPGLRMLEKAAVRAGGGKNHRAGLNDAILIKENHIEAAGSVTHAVKLAKAYAGHMMKVEVEIENERELKEAIAAAPDVIMFDNCSLDETKAWAAMVPTGIITELSGGMKPGNLRAAAETGIDYISIGALTHSAAALDMSLLLKRERDQLEYI